MQPLKKFFTEGLIQVAIVLSLGGMYIDVIPYLPHNLNTQSPDLTQTQSNNFQNSLEQCGLHIKIPSVEASVPDPRLLHWVHSLQPLNIPTAHLEAWLVHSESDNSRMTIPSLTDSWDGADMLLDIEDTTSLTMRMEVGGGGDLEDDPVTDDGSLEVVTTLSRSQMDSENIKEETDEWSEINQNIHQDQLLRGQNQYFSLINEDNEDEVMVDSWQHANPFHNPMSSIRGNVQVTGLQENNSLSTEEYLQLLEACFSPGNDQYMTDLDPVRAGEDQLQHHESLFSTLLPQHEPMLDLEQQWQDVSSVLSPQNMNTEDFLNSSHLYERGRARETGTLDNPIQQNLSFYQPFSRSNQSSFASSRAIREDLSNQNNTFGSLDVSNSSDGYLNFSDPAITDFLLSASPDSSHVSIPSFPMEDPSQLSLFGPLLKESMLDENGLLDLAKENGQGQSEVFQNEHKTDSDSGLSLDYSESPISSSRSESSSCSSSSSSSSRSSTSSVTEEGAVGYTIKEEPLDEEGAVGGYSPEQNKMCYSNYLHFQHSPWLEHIGHDHTYNQAQYSRNQRKPPKEHSEELLENNLLDKLSSRDQKRARAMRIPFSTARIINLPVEEFNELLAKHRLSEAQLTLIRDIRRRGKNKVAAQNCRRRKLDILQDLERSVDNLRHHRARLLREKSDVLHSVREMKQRLNDLYQEVRSRISEVERIPCSAMDFPLQAGNDNHVSKSRQKSGKKKKR